MTKWGFNSRITFLENLGKKCRETCISRLNQRNVILEYSRFTCFSLKNIRELHNSRRVATVTTTQPMHLGTTYPTHATLEMVPMPNLFEQR